MENERKTFTATVLGNSLQRSREKGTPSVVIRYRTQYNTSSPGTPCELNLIGNLWLTYKTTAGTIKTLQEVFGWKGHYITDFNEPILTGKKCELVCETEEYQDKLRWKVLFVNRPGGFKKLSNEDLCELVKDVQPMIDEVVGVKPDLERESQPGLEDVPGITEQAKVLNRIPDTDDMPF